jgi:hypothetical protein
VGKKWTRNENGIFRVTMGDKKTRKSEDKREGLLKVRATREVGSLSESGLIWKVQSTVSGEEFVGKMNEIKYGDGKMKRILGSDFFFFWFLVRCVVSTRDSDILLRTGLLRSQSRVTKLPWHPCKTKWDGMV